MSTNHDLERAVQDFRSIESRLTELADQTETVAGAGDRLASAEETLKAVHAAVADSLERHTALVEQLAGLASDLAETTEVVRRGDPSKMFEAVERLTADFERQKERVSEMAGEIRVRIEEATRSIDVSVADSGEEVTKALDEQSTALAAAVDQAKADLDEALRKSDEAAEKRITEAERRLRIPAIAAAVFSGTAVVLLIVVLIVT